MVILPTMITIDFNPSPYIYIINMYIYNMIYVYIKCIYIYMNVCSMSCLYMYEQVCVKPYVVGRNEQWALKRWWFRSLKWPRCAIFNFQLYFLHTRIQEKNPFQFHLLRRSNQARKKNNIHLLPTWGSWQEWSGLTPTLRFRWPAKVTWSPNGQGIEPSLGDVGEHSAWRG